MNKREIKIVKNAIKTGHCPYIIKKGVPVPLNECVEKDDKR